MLKYKQEQEFLRGCSSPHHCHLDVEKYQYISECYVLNHVGNSMFQMNR